MTGLPAPSRKGGTGLAMLKPEREILRNSGMIPATVSLDFAVENHAERIESREAGKVSSAGFPLNRIQ